MSETPRQSLADRVYEHILSFLASRKLKVGNRLKPRNFTEELLVSRTTVNTALDRLIKEGWVTAEANGRLIVTSYPPKGDVVKHSKFDFSNQTDTTYESLLEQILRGDFKPGEIFKERPVAATLGVNPATVRRAAEWLRNDRLLERLPRRGWRVAKLQLRDVNDTYQMRLLLEPLGLQWAVHRITDEALIELEAECKQLAKAGEKATSYDRRRADYHFHQTLAEASGSRVLAETLEPLIRKLLLITTVRFRFTRSTQTFEEHQQIIQALKQRDANEVIRLIKAHLQSALQHNLNTWEEP